MASDQSSPKKKRTKQPPPDVLDGAGSVDGALAPMLKIERFTFATVHRNQLKNAEYNPRKMSDEQRRRLRGGLEKLGYLGGVVWNVRTGNIVGGHQRVRLFDMIQGSPDYRLTVCQVDLSEKEEKEANVLLNNDEAQGEYELELLAPLLRDPGLDLTAMGWDPADVHQMFGLEGMMDRPAPEVEHFTNMLEGARERQQKLVKDAKQRDGDGFYIVLVFNAQSSVVEFLNLCGLPETVFQNGDRVRQLIDARAPEKAQEPEAGKAKKPKGEKHIRKGGGKDLAEHQTETVPERRNRRVGSPAAPPEPAQ